MKSVYIYISFVEINTSKKMQFIYRDFFEEEKKWFPS